MKRPLGIMFGCLIALLMFTGISLGQDVAVPQSQPLDQNSSSPPADDLATELAAWTSQARKLVASGDKSADQCKELAERVAQAFSSADPMTLDMSKWIDVSTSLAKYYSEETRKAMATAIAAQYAADKVAISKLDETTLNKVSGALSKLGDEKSSQSFLVAWTTESDKYKTASLATFLKLADAAKAAAEAGSQARSRLADQVALKYLEIGRASCRERV